MADAEPRTAPTISAVFAPPDNGLAGIAGIAGIGMESVDARSAPDWLESPRLINRSLPLATVKDCLVEVLRTLTVPSSTRTSKAPEPTKATVPLD